MSKVLSTTDYGIFKPLTGNRMVDEKHVRTLERLMQRRGNLTPQFPIVINKSGEVLDGQHRLMALQRLGWEAYYTVQDNMNLEDVRAINIGHRNWTWKDYAESFATLGNKNYQRLLMLYEEFHLPYYVILLYIGQSRLKTSGRPSLQRQGYQEGNLLLSAERYDHARTLLGQALDIIGALEIHSSDRAAFGALYRILRNEQYNHDHMMKRIASYQGRAIEKARSVDEYLRAFEEIYNLYARDGREVRLF